MKRKMKDWFVAGGFARLAVCALLSLAGAWSPAFGGNVRMGTHYPTVYGKVGVPLKNPDTGLDFVDIDWADIDNYAGEDFGESSFSVDKASLPSWLKWESVTTVKDKNKRVQRSWSESTPWYPFEGGKFYPISGTPTAAGTWNVKATARWSDGVSVTVTIQIVVQSVPAVTFDANGGKIGTQAKVTLVCEEKDDDLYACVMPADPVNPKGEFDGWWTAKVGGVQVRPGDEFDASVFENPKTPTLYARWTLNADAVWTVTFDANGGSGATECKVEKGKAVGTLPTSERDGFAFLGWFTAAAGGTQVTATTKATKDVTYYAHWQYKGAATDSTVVFETEDGYTTESDGSFSLNLAEVIGSTSVPKVTVKGLPAGLKFDAKTLAISGVATKPGVYTVTVSVTNATVKKAETTTFEIVVPNLSCDALPGLEPETDAYGVVRCGVAFDPALVNCSPEDGWTVKAAGLPAGLKWDAKTGTITGVPTKAGTFTVTFTATKKGEKNQTATITLVTEALPAWAVGTFAGVATGERGAAGAASMSVTEAGKISGKFAVDGTNWTFSASSYFGCDAGGGHAAAMAKAGRLTKELIIEVSPCDSPDGTLVNSAAFASIEDGSIDITLNRNMWKDRSTAPAAKSLLTSLTGVYTASVGADYECGAGYLSFACP